MSDHVPIPDPVAAAAERRAAADPDGPVPGRLDLSREPSPAATTEPMPVSLPSGLSEPPASADAAAAGSSSSRPRPPRR